MSKKKATMTLKDFHGGSIPSDLPLPSAPGVTARSMDRPVFDRPGPWGNPMGRSNHPLRPGSAGSVRSKFDDKTPFLGPTTHIGRHFDEDERKPLDGESGPRRTVSDDSIHPLPTRIEVAKPSFSASFTQPHSQQISNASPISYASRVFEAPHGGTVGPVDPVSFPNVWATRKETVSVAELSPSTSLGPDAASKLAHASALDKVSSGRWQSNKHPIHHPTNIDPKMGSSYISVDVADGVEYQDGILVRHAERNLTLNDGIFGGVKEAHPHVYSNNKIDISHSGKFVGFVTPLVASQEQLERPKLKLLPRSKPLDSSDPPIDHNQGYYQPQNYDIVHKVNESYETSSDANSGFGGADGGNLAVERPKLNIKPRSQAVKQVDENKEKGRTTVFGGARPRELVLKERGTGDIAVKNHDVIQSPNRVKQDLPRTGTISHHPTPCRSSLKTEVTPLENRTRKINDKHDNRIDATEMIDTQQRNTPRQQRNMPRHQQSQERAPSPDTWRKPVEEPRPLSSRKAASAVELAQAFSKSVSDPKMVERSPNQRGTIPFSRLTDPSSRPQLNGY